MAYKVSVWEDETNSRNGWWLWLHSNVNVLEATGKYTSKFIGDVYTGKTKTDGKIEHK